MQKLCWLFCVINFPFHQSFHTLSLWVGLKGKKNSEYQIKGKKVKTNIEANTSTLSDIEIVQISIFFIELTTEN